jgi:hypothetical protein
MWDVPLAPRTRTFIVRYEAVRVREKVSGATMGGLDALYTLSRALNGKWMDDYQASKEMCSRCTVACVMDGHSVDQNRRVNVGSISLLISCFISSAVRFVRWRRHRPSQQCAMHAIG